MSVPLSEIVDVTVTSLTPVLGTSDFGRILVLGEFDTAVFPERVREYASPAEAAEDFATTSAEYKAVAAAFADPEGFNPSGVLVGRRVPGTAQVYTIALTDPTSGSGTIEVLVDGVTIAGITVASGDSDADMVTALVAAINEDTQQPFVAAAGGLANEVDLTSQHGANDYTLTTSVTGTGTAAAVTEDTAPVAPAESVTDALNAIAAVTEDFFGLALVSKRQADIEAAAAWIAASTLDRLGHFRANDPTETGVTDAASTTDVGYTLSNSNYSHVLTMYHDQPWFFPEIRALGSRLGVSPDESSTTWVNLTLGGCPTSKLGTTKRNALVAKNVSYYSEVGGVGNFFVGKAADGEFIDIDYYSSWLKARLQERVFNLIKGETNSGSKVPFDDDGAKSLEGELRSQIIEAQDLGHISEEPEPEYTTVPREEISSDVAATRQYPAFKAIAYWSGAIHRAAFRVTLTV